MEYIDNMQAEYEWCDVIIARAGASTISELAIIKKPVLIFPYPKATDNHQLYNAQIFRDESDFTVEVLDPNLPQNDSLKATQEFLVKASQEALKYSQTPHPGNQTCHEILREIRNHVGMA
jgi:UDP-N-acetylglucosamine:LPS N-acetylglucosamine transferase